MEARPRPGQLRAFLGKALEDGPEHHILDIARWKKIDLIAPGHHGENALEGFFIGRNIDRIMDHAARAAPIARIHPHEEMAQEEMGREAGVRARPLTRSLKEDE